MPALKKVMRREMWEAQGERCFYCYKKFPLDKITNDHVFPRSLGYALRDNVVAACERCNTHKCSTFPNLFVIWNAVELYESMGKIFEPMFCHESGQTVVTPNRKEHRNFWKRIGITRTPPPVMWEMSGIISDDVLAAQIDALHV